MELIKQSTATPWKAINEVLMYAQTVLVYILAFCKGVSIGVNAKFYGLPKILKYSGSTISIGNKFENRNHLLSNPLGVNHPTIICTWSKDAKILIGDDVGIGGGSIVSSSSVTIGNGTLIGANCAIIDTDFHPVKSDNRRYDKSSIKTLPVVIGKNVFIGMNVIILKGSYIHDNSVVPAGSVVRGEFK